MKKVYIYALACALSVISCQDNEWVADNATSQVLNLKFPWELLTANCLSSSSLK